MERVARLAIFAVVFALGTAVSHALTTTTFTITPTQTTWALGQAFCEHGGVYCYGVPITNGTQHASIWIDIQPYQNPTSSRFITGIPELASGWAQVNLGSYHYTKKQATYTTGDGKHWTGLVPGSITLTFTQVVVENNTVVIPPHPITGTATIVFGKYYYVDTCSGRGCGGVLGWHYSVVGGTLIVRKN